MGLCRFNVADTKKLDMQLVNRYVACDIGWSRLHKCYFAHPGLEITQMYADKIFTIKNGVKIMADLIVGSDPEVINLKQK